MRGENVLLLNKETMGEVVREYLAARTVNLELLVTDVEQDSSQHPRIFRVSVVAVEPEVPADIPVDEEEG
jgi:hypothetical protein